MSPANGGGGDYYTSPPHFSFPFHLLELTVISAQDLFPALKSSMRTYAVAWITPDTKLRTRIDPVGHTDPTWNDKFVFRVDDATLRSDMAAVTIEIYAVRSKLRPGSDTVLGTARAMLSTLRPTTTTRFIALQVRRPSLRPQGMLNVGVALMDSYVRSLATYAEVKKEEKKEENIVMTAAEREKALVQSKLDKWRAEVKGGKVKVEEKKVVKVEEKKVVTVAEREKAAVQSKLEKWRAELRPMKDGEKKERREGMMAGVVKSRRTPGRMSCFSSAGDEKVVKEGDDGGGK